MSTSAFLPGQLAGMQQTQQSVMQHQARFIPYAPTQDSESGQMVVGDTGNSTIDLGVDFSPKGQLIDGTEGTVIAHYKLRLKPSMADVATSLSRYEVTHAYGAYLTNALLLEQVGPVSVGPSGVVAWARRVAV
jgi:hypothetical protein